MWNHFRSIWLMLTGLQIPTGIAPPPSICLGYFLLIWVGVAKGNIVMDQPSVWDTILELYEMSPKINYFDLAFQCHISFCFLVFCYATHIWTDDRVPVFYTNQSAVTSVLTIWRRSINRSRPPPPTGPVTVSGFGWGLALALDYSRIFFKCNGEISLFTICLYPCVLQGKKTCRTSAE